MNVLLEHSFIFRGPLMTFVNSLKIYGQKYFKDYEYTHSPNLCIFKLGNFKCAYFVKSRNI